VLQDSGSERLHVIERGRKAAFEQSLGADGEHERLARTRTGTPADVLFHSRQIALLGTTGLHELQNTIHHFLADGQLADELLRFDDFFGLENGRGFFGVCAGGDEHHLAFIIGGRIRDIHLQHETVELRFGQRIGAFLLERVLRGHDVKRARQVVGNAANGHLVFLHCLQQRGLRAWAGAVDFIGHEELAEHGAFNKFETTVMSLAAEDFRAENISGHEVGRTLHALVIEAHHGAKRINEFGLAKTRQTHEQEVTAREDRGQAQINHLLLPENYLVNVLLRGGEFGRQRAHLLFKVAGHFGGERLYGHRGSLCYGIVYNVYIIGHTANSGKIFLIFSGKLHQQAWMIAPETQSVMKALLENGGDARFVGGCVRNALVNRPVTDIDIATPLVPDAVIERLKSHKIAYAPVGLKHGTVTAIVDGVPFEITTLRLDVQTFGRHAEVKFTDDWKTDASRRDFTMNAIFSTIDGDLFDPFGGIGDLRRGHVRFVGDAARRIEEDVLRILRFFRFHAHFGRGNPDQEALAACAAAAKQVARLSAERIRTEVLKLLESDHCPSVWQLMAGCGVVTHFLPEATNIAALENLVQIEAKLETSPFALRRLAALLEVTEAGFAHVIKALRLSNEQAAQLTAMMNDDVSLPMTAHEIRKRVFKTGNDIVRSQLLLTAARSGEKEGLRELYDIATHFQPPLLPLRGEDILQLGRKPGPDIGRILVELEEWWINADFAPDRQACLERLKTIAG